MQINVWLSRAAVEDVSVNWQAVDDTALAGVDYTATSGAGYTATANIGNLTELSPDNQTFAWE